MRRIKQFFLPLCLLVTASAPIAQAFAELPLPAKPHWYMAVEGDLLKAANGETAYTILDDNAPAVLPEGVLKQVGTDYHIAGGFSLGRFFNSNSDVRLSFFTHNNTDHSVEEQEGPPFADTLLLPPEIEEGVVNSQRAESDYRYRTTLLNVLFGHWFYPTQVLYLHPYMGLNLSDIRVRQSTVYSDFPGEDIDPIVAIEDSGVTGVGPITGVNLRYRLTHTFSLEGNMGLGLLVGNIRSSFNVLSAPEEGDPSDYTRINSRTRLSVFEWLNASFGVGYHMPLSEDSALHITAGYKISEYINAVSRHSLVDSERLKSSLHLFEDTGFSGPFLSIGLSLT